jgi:hypothetical protein
VADKDLAMMLAAHEAFRRDLRRLVAQPNLPVWQRFHDQLLVHHRAEDVVLWPRMRRRGVDSALLNTMEAEHSRIDPLLRAVSAAFKVRNFDDLRMHLKSLSEVLREHLLHEEGKVLPLISEEEWTALDQEFRRRVGVRSIGSYFTWLLEDAPPELRDRVVRSLPLPVRLLIRRAGR